MFIALLLLASIAMQLTSFLVAVTQLHQTLKAEEEFQLLKRRREAQELGTMKVFDSDTSFPACMLQNYVALDC